MNQGFVRRLIALIKKEMHQMLRDRSNLTVGFLLPITLILLFGYGISFDVTNAPLAMVMEDRSPTARDVVSGFASNEYLKPIWVKDMDEAAALIRRGEADGILRVPSDFSRQLAAGDAKIQLLLNGVNSTTASTIEGYVSGALGHWAEVQLDRNATGSTGGSVSIVQRMWFNEASISTWYLVPGLTVLIFTLIGAFLTSLLIAREWERGTLESLFVTPVRPLEIVLAKIAPFLVVGFIDLVICMLAARYIFDVPIRAPLWQVAAMSMLYLLVSLLLGLFISARTRSQFMASQVALLASFMPAMMLSGFIFDLRNAPVFVQGVSMLLPATHFMSSIKTLMLAGAHGPTTLQAAGILSLYALVLIIATCRLMRKTLDARG